MFKKIIFIVFTLFLIQIPAFAILNLELTKGVDQAIPIAIVPFGNVLAIPTNLTQIISSDLRNSGQFKIMNVDTLNQFPHTLEAVNFDYWRNLNVDNLVVGRLSPTGSGQYDVYFNLFAIYKNSLYKYVKSRLSAIMQSGANPILLDQVFHKIKPDQARRLAHHIADLIYKKLIGIPGIFSTKIAYVLVKQNQYGQPIQFSLVIADADGYNPQPILISPEPILSPAWSPDGKKIAYVSLEKDHAAIYVSDAVTGKRFLVTKFSGINGAPAWSPDGKKLALVLSKTGNPNIYLIDLRSKKLRQLTHDWSIDTEPTFSPDGKSLIFTSDRAGGPQIYCIRLSDGAINRLTFVGNYNARASFTPDGKSIVMLHRDQGKYNIAIQNLKSGHLSLLSHATDDQSPSIAPNGKMIIYASHQGNKGILAIVSTDGQVHLNLPATDRDVREPVWGPFVN